MKKTTTILMLVTSLAFGAEPVSPTLLVLKGSPRHFTDAGEDQTKQDARLADIQRAIDSATEDPMERAVLATIAVFETHLAAYVYEGRCSDGPRGKHECDKGKAFGPWQIHAAPAVPVPTTTAGQALRAIQLYRGGYNRCKQVVNDPVSAGLAHYGRGNSCGSTPSSDKRAKHARSLARRL
jgi:hypothetical protein